MGALCIKRSYLRHCAGSEKELRPKKAEEEKEASPPRAVNREKYGKDRCDLCQRYI